MGPEFMLAVSRAILKNMFAILISAALLYGQSARSASSRSLYRKGVAQLQAGDLKGAEITFEKLVRSYPDNADAQNSLGWVLFTEDKLDQAVSHLRLALKLRPHFVDADIDLASALVRKGELAEATKLAQEAVHLAPNNAEA